MLMILESKAAAADTVLLVTDIAMRAAGGTAFNRRLGLERRFRDARAADVLGITSDMLLDFIGRSLCGMPVP
jgi:alkylation response protein AidB-like acyl-CoA dehydrogenase